MNEAQDDFELDLGVPMARNALVYALVGLALTAVIGLFVWDLLGLIFGIPLSVLGMVRGALALPRTGPYPRDRTRAVAAVVAGCLALFLVWPIWSSASDAGDEPVDCDGDRACEEHQQ